MVRVSPLEKLDGPGFKRHRLFNVIGPLPLIVSEIIELPSVDLTDVSQIRMHAVDIRSCKFTTLPSMRSGALRLGIVPRH
jgi:hypothetical protein